MYYKTVHAHRERIYIIQNINLFYLRNQIFNNFLSLLLHSALHKQLLNKINKFVNKFNK